MIRRKPILGPPGASSLRWRELSLRIFAIWFLFFPAGRSFADTKDVSIHDGNPLPLLTTGRELINLSVPETQRHYPIHLCGVVTFFDARSRNLFVQDGTAGFWVYPEFQTTNLALGQSVEIVGVSDGVHGSHAKPSSLKVIGTAPLPQPKPTTLDQLGSGKHDCQWLEVEGVVHTMAFRGKYLKIDLMVGHDHIPISLPSSGKEPFPTNLISARVEARGVCSMNLNREGKIIGFWLFVQNLESVTILRPADPEILSRPARSVKSLSIYPLNSHFGERVKVAGVVTLSQPSGALFLRDETGALQVHVMQPWPHDGFNGRSLNPPPAPVVQAGDRVEVVGYPLSGMPLFSLVDAEYHLAGPSAGTPPPIPITADDAANDRFDAELVSLKARVLEHESRLGGRTTNQVLVLEAGNRVFEAELEDAPARALDIPNASVVRVTGVNSIQIDPWSKVRSFRLLLRGSGDLAVLSSPSPWNFQTAVRVGAVGAAIILGAVVWIAVLRHRVTTRTARLAAANDRLVKEVGERQQVEGELRRVETDLRAALEKERELNELKSNFVNLVSHEFRTPLSIILSSADILSAYLDTLSEGERAEHLNDIRNCSRHMAGMMEEVLVLGRVEAGKMQFRPVALEIPGFCRRLVDEVLSATDQRRPIELTERDIDERARGDEGLLRHIFQNLLSNAVKYSHPGETVRFSVYREEGDAVFTVRDRGIGIPPEDLKRIFTAFHRGANVGQLPGSGLGLVIVRRCVDLHGGRIQIDSTEGQGTTVVVRLPLFVKTGHTSTLHRSAPVAASN